MWSSDVLIVSMNAVASRWGGDEFVVAGKDISLADGFEKKLEAALEKRNDLDKLAKLKNKHF